MGRGPEVTQGKREQAGRTTKNHQLCQLLLGAKPRLRERQGGAQVTLEAGQHGTPAPQTWALSRHSHGSSHFLE